MAEGVKRCGNRYYASSVEKSINENLAKKTIVEYPCFYISLASEEQQWQKLHLIDSDENLEEEVNEHYQKLNEMRKVFLEKYGIAPPKDDKGDPITKQNEDRSTKHAKRTEEIMANVEDEEGNMKHIQEKINCDETMVQIMEPSYRPKQEEYYQTTNNFLFTDEKVLDALSSSDEETDVRNNYRINQ